MTINERLLNLCELGSKAIDDYEESVQFDDELQAISDEWDEMVRVLEACLHQLSTDSDLDNITGAEKYAKLVRLLEECLGKG